MECFSVVIILIQKNTPLECVPRIVYIEYSMSKIYSNKLILHNGYNTEKNCQVSYEALLHEIILIKTMLLLYNATLLLLDINLIQANSNVFILSTFISTHPQLNIVSSGAIVVSAKPWKTRGRATRQLKLTTSLTVPQWIINKERSISIGGWITRFTKKIIANERLWLLVTVTRISIMSVAPGRYQCPDMLTRRSMSDANSVNIV